MPIEFRDIEHEEQAEREAPFSHVGIIFFGENGEWYARRVGTDFEASGDGVPQRLENGLWVADMEYDEVRAISKEMRGLSMRSDGWFKLPIRQIRNAFGLGGRTAEQSLPIVAAIADRVYRLTQEALRANMSEMGYRAPQEFQSGMERASSLATAIATVNEAAMKRSGSSEKRVIEHFARTWQSGIYITNRKEAPEGHLNLSFHFPRLSYALNVTAGDVPATSAWQIASRPDDQGVEEFLQQMRRTGRPAIYKAMCQPGEAFVPEHVQAFANGLSSSMGDAHRARFIDDEIRLLSPHYRMMIEGVIAGSGWRPSATGQLLRCLEDCAGGPEASRASWSAGLAAENILASAMRAARKESPGQTAEAVWIAARDRAAMVPAIGALTDVGAMLVSANCGTITVRCPADIEMLMLILDAAWEAGLLLPLETVEELRRMGVPIPSGQSLFGGISVDYLLSAAVHKRQRNALWALDGIMDLPADERARRFRIIISG